MKAMSHGLPVFADDDISLNDLVHCSINGYMFARGDTDAISNAINIILGIQYVNNGMRRKSLGYIQLYDLDKTVVLLEELYNKRKYPFHMQVK